MCAALGCAGRVPTRMLSRQHGAEGTLVRFDKSTERWDTMLGDGEQKVLIPFKVRASPAAGFHFVIQDEVWISY